MANFPVNIADNLYLHNQLHDGAEDKYVRCTLTDDQRVSLPASPVDLTHNVNGLYDDFNIEMPTDTNFVTATYRVYNDALYTVPSAVHSDAIDTFTLVLPAQEILDILASIQADIDLLLSRGIQIGISGILQGEKTLHGVTMDEKLITELEGEKALSGKVEGEPILTGILEDETNPLEGEF